MLVLRPFVWLCRLVSTCFFTKSNCLSASAARVSWILSPVLAAVRPWLKCSQLLGLFVIYAVAQNECRLEPETTVKAMKNIVAQSAIAFHVSIDIEKSPET